MKSKNFIYLLLIFLVFFESTALPDEKVNEESKNKAKYRKSKLTYDESEALADKRKLLLTTGEDKTVDLDFEANTSANGITYGNPSLLTTTLVKIGADKRQLVFKPLKAGETTVTVRDADGVIRIIFFVRVTGTDLLRIAAEIRNLLRDVEGLEIRIVGPKVVIEGEVLVPNDYGRLLTVIMDKTYTDYVLNMTSLSPMAIQIMAKRIQDDILAFAPNVKTRVVNGMIFLEGSVDNIDQANRAEKIANLYLPELKPGSALEKDPSLQRLPGRKLVYNFLIVNPAPPKKEAKLVRVTIHLVELNKDYSKLFGFKWQPGFTADPTIAVGQTAAGAAGASSGPSFSATISSLIPKLDSAQTAGYARVLKTGTVIVVSGQPAKLTEATEFPFAQTGQNGQQTFGSKGVGFTLAVTPQILGRTEDIEMHLEVDETSLVGRAPATGAPPTTAKHSVATKLYVKSNESAAIAGVMASDIGTDFNKDDPAPGTFDPTSSTNALFSLLHTKNFRKKKSQFVIFVTPQIIENASEGTDDLKKNFRVKAK